MLSVSGTPEGRNATLTYLSRFGRALLLGKKAIKAGIKKVSFDRNGYL